MLGFYLDSAMTRPITTSAPKRFLAPTAGITKYGTIYLGDPYSSIITFAASSGSTLLTLSDTSEFLSTGGTATINGITITYTGVLGLTLTGVTGLTSLAPLGSVIVPNNKWMSTSQIIINTTGPDVVNIQASIRQSGAPSFNFIGMPLILSTNNIKVGSASIPIDVQVIVPPGAEEEFYNWAINAGPFYFEAESAGTPDTSIFGLTATAPGYVNRRDQALQQFIRLLPLNRQVSNSPPGFIIGQYKWRNESEINEQTIIPTNWLTDPTTLGNQLFVAGVGQSTDLEPVDFTQVNNSIYLQIKRGFYFTGPKGYYLPATPQLDFINSSNTVLNLSKVPQPILPMFVGTWSLDSQGFYEKNLEYRYETSKAVAANTNLPEYYYQINREGPTIILNKPQPNITMYLGLISGDPIDYFNLPTYPVDSIQKVYVIQPSINLPVYNWSFNRDLGTLTITNPTGSGPSAPKSYQGQIVVAVCTPALAVLYETGTTDTLTIDSINLNPAFAGISSGYVYLQHSRQQVNSLVLSCDKPLISIPATYSSIIGLVAYGPVYFDGDYALLQVTAFSEVPGQIIQGAELEVIVDPTTFTGTLNYQNPLTETVTVTTGADGIANLIYKPSANYGFYIPTATSSGSLAGLATTNVPNDTIVLPQAVPISQIYAPLETQPWLAYLYSVYNDNPILGLAGDTNVGQIAWSTSGTPGTVNYETNGYIEPILNSQQDTLYPIQALDSSGIDSGSVGFSGNVVKLVYGQAIPLASSTGAYFITFIQRTLIRIGEVGSDVKSNSILLQMAVNLPAPYNPALYLTLDNTTLGVLGKYRLGISI